MTHDRAPRPLLSHASGEHVDESRYHVCKIPCTSCGRPHRYWGKCAACLQREFYAGRCGHYRRCNISPCPACSALSHGGGFGVEADHTHRVGAS